MRRHRKTDPACGKFRGYPGNRLTRWWFDRGRGKACRPCMDARNFAQLVAMFDALPKGRLK